MFCYRKINGLPQNMSSDGLAKHFLRMCSNKVAEVIERDPLRLISIARSISDSGISIGLG